MADIFTKAKRSEVMSRIRSRGNRDTEGAMVLLLRAAGIRGWRRQVVVWLKGRLVKSLKGRAVESLKRKSVKRLKGGEGRSGDLTARRFNRLTKPFRVRPDFVWRKERVALFVDGCFWHGCPWHGTKPSSNKSFWQEKLARNRERDRLVSRRLRRAGWQVVRVWEHVLPRAAREVRERERLVERIGKELNRRIRRIRGPAAPAGQ